MDDGEEDSKYSNQSGVEHNSYSMRYLGDFKFSVYFKNYLVLTDDGWKDADLDKHDENSESVYFKDDIKVASNVAKFMAAISTDDFTEMYVPGKGGIIMFGG